MPSPSSEGWQGSCRLDGDGCRHGASQRNDHPADPASKRSLERAVMERLDRHAIVEAQFAQPPRIARREPGPIDRGDARCPVEGKLVETHGRTFKLFVRLISNKRAPTPARIVSPLPVNFWETAFDFDRWRGCVVVACPQFSLGARCTAIFWGLPVDADSSAVAAGAQIGAPAAQ